MADNLSFLAGTTPEERGILTANSDLAEHVEATLFGLADNLYDPDPDIDGYGPEELEASIKADLCSLAITGYKAGQEAGPNVDVDTVVLQVDADKLDFIYEELELVYKRARRIAPVHAAKVVEAIAALGYTHTAQAMENELADDADMRGEG